MTVKLLVQLIDLLMLILRKMDQKAYEKKSNEITQDVVAYRNSRVKPVVSDDVDKALSGDSESER